MIGVLWPTLGAPGITPPIAVVTSGGLGFQCANTGADVGVQQCKKELC